MKRRRRSISREGYRHITEIRGRKYVKRALFIQGSLLLVSINSFKSCVALYVDDGEVKMKKVLIIGLILCFLSVSGCGGAYADAVTLNACISEEPLTIQLDKNNPDTDGDGLYDDEEVILLRRYDGNKLVIIGNFISNPLDEDTDNDGVSDFEEVMIGTKPLKNDTDNDGLMDGIECSEGFDPLSADPDGDKRSDLKEYTEGTDPYFYNRKWSEYIRDFNKGFVCGDFIEDPDSIATVMGQITSSFIPLVDIRDVIGNVKNDDYFFAGMSVVGLIPDVGDVAKAVTATGKFGLVLV